MAGGCGAAALWAVALGAVAIPTSAGADPAGAKPFVVSVLGGGDALSIGDALSRAPPGTPIVVRTGTYRESLTISRAVDLRADGGDPKNVVVDGVRGPALLVRAEGVLVKGLTLRVHKAGDFVPDAAVIVESGAATLDGCVLASDGVHGASARGATAKLTLFGCSVAGAPQQGVSAKEGATVTLERCTIEGARETGLSVFSGASAQGKEVTITGSAGHGAAAVGGASLRLEGGRISGNGGRGVEAEDAKTSVTLLNVVLDAGRDNAVVVSGGAQLEAVGCEASGHVKSGFILKGEGTRGVLRGCRIHHNKGSGILFEVQSTGLVEDGDVGSNTLVGIEVREGCKAEIRRTKVHHHETGAGILCHDATSSVRVEGCDLYGGKVDGVEVWDGGTADVRATKIRDQGSYAVAVDKDGKLLLADVEISGSVEVGVWTEGPSSIEVERTTIHDGKGYGVWMNKGATASFTACEVFANADFAFVVTGAANLTLKGGKVRDGKKGALRFDKDAGGTLTGVEITGNRGAGIEVDGGAPTVRECKVKKNTGPGVWIRSGGGGTFEKCELTDNVGGAWVLEDASKVVRKGNRPSK